MLISFFQVGCCWSPWWFLKLLRKKKSSLIQYVVFHYVCFGPQTPGKTDGLVPHTRALNKESSSTVLANSTEMQRRTKVSRCY